MLTDSCFIASDVSEGDIFDVGGSIINSNVCHKIKADFSQLSDLYAKVDHSFAASDMNGLQGYAESLGTNANPDMFASLFLLQKVIEKHVWPKTSKNLFDRGKLYEDGKETPLSEIVKAEQMACVELALFAAKPLQDRGMSVRMISGTFVGQKIEPGGEDYNEPHTFLAIDDPGSDKVLIYDPANPIISNHGQFPSIFAIPQAEFDFWLEKAQSGTAYLQADEELSGKTKYYGASAPMLCFWPDKHVVQRPQSVSETVSKPEEFHI